MSDEADLLELTEADVDLRLAKLELRVDLLAKALATALKHCQDAPTADPGLTPPWRITSAGGAL